MTVDNPTWTTFPLPLIQHHPDRLFVSSIQLYEGNGYSVGTTAASATAPLAGATQQQQQQQATVSIACERGQDGLVSIQSLAAEAPLEYIQDPSPPPSCSSSGNGFFPRLLLKAHASGELRVSFSLEGPMVALAAGATTDSDAGIMTSSTFNTSSMSRPSSLCDSALSATTSISLSSSTAAFPLPHSLPPQDENQQEPSPPWPVGDVHDTPAATEDLSNLAESSRAAALAQPAVSGHHEHVGNSSNDRSDSDTAAIAAENQLDSNDRTNSSSLQSQEHAPELREPNLHEQRDNKVAVAVPVVATSAAAATAPTDNTAPPKLPPRLYFVETMSEADLLDLCDDKEFQQQAKLNPSMVNVVQPTSIDGSSPPMFHWEWRSPSQDRMEGDFTGHKAVLAFMARNPRTGQLEILSQLALWVTNHTQLEQATGTRYVPSHHTSNSSRHWRRAATPERSSMSTGHLPSLPNRISALPASHMSLPSLPEAAAELSQPDTLPVNTAPSSLTGTANTTPMGFDTEDGPLFRATVNECENHIKDMKNATKRILKAAQTVMETRKVWASAEEAFAKELETFRPAEPLVARYSRPMAQNLSERVDVLSQQMRNLLIEPLTRFYTSDLKASDTQRKTFDEESRDYYTFLSKYMGMKQDSGRKKIEADAKYEKKRRQFELKRLEYWGFLLDMRVGGSKSDEILHHLTNYSEKHCKHVSDLGILAEDLRAGLDRMNEQLLESHRRTALIRKEWQEKRRELLDTPDDSFGLSPGGLSRSRSPLGRTGSNNEIVGAPLLSSQSSTEGGTGPTGTPRRKGSLPGPTLGEPRRSQDGLPGLPSVSPPSSNGSQQSQVNQAQSRKFAGIRDLEQQDVDASQALGRRKEGFLFATSRPSMHNNSNVLEKPSINWHKYWCVLSEGHLHEYSHWKKGVTTLHNEPIHLKTATVRPSRSQDRRFCFEVITPKFRRVYQAMSEEDMQSWITIISNAIQSLLNGTSSYRNLNISSIAPDYQRLLSGSGGSAELSGRPSMEQTLIATSLPDSMQDRIHLGQAIGKKRGTSAAYGLNELGQMMMLPSHTNSNNSDTASISDQDQLGVRLLDAMRASNLANNFCAECGAKNPDWCAINLGILLCIECSGIHRSLGTHISKVRSFTLDTTSYTRDLFDFIRAIGNECSNQVWEATLLKDGTNGTPAIRKPVHNDSRDYKVEFIQKKYVDRLFVDRLQFVPEEERTSTIGKEWTNKELAAYATKALIQASVNNDIPAVLASYAAGADLNAIQEVEVEQETAGSCISDISDQPSQNGSMELSPSPLPSTPAPHPQQQNTTEDSESEASGKHETVATTPTTPAQEEVATCSSPPPAIMTTSPDLRSRSWTGYSNASFCLMQTSPLLLALRHGTPFSLDPQYEVYPLAEFMLQNGAASNLSIEVRLLDDTPLERNSATARDSFSSLAAGDDDRLAINGDGLSAEQASKRSSIALSVTSITSEQTTSVSATNSSSSVSTPGPPSVAAAAAGAGGAIATTASPSSLNNSRNGWDALDVDPEQLRQLHMRTNRRSLGQVVHMRGEEGATAMEYLRSKSAARGEPLSGSPLMQPRPSISLGSTPVSTATIMMAGGISNNSFVGEMTGLSSAEANSTTATVTMPSSGKRPTSSGDSGRGLAPVLSVIKDNLSGGCDERSKESQEGGSGNANVNVTPGQHPSSSSSDVTPNVTKESAPNNSVPNSGGGAVGNSPARTANVSPPSGSHGHEGRHGQSHHERHNSRAGKMKATLTKSLRMSAAYIKHSIGKDDKDHHHNIPALLSPSSSSTSSGTSSILSGSLFSPPSASIPLATKDAMVLPSSAAASAAAAPSSNDNSSTTPASGNGGKERTRTTSANTVLSALSGKGSKASSSSHSVEADSAAATPLSGQYVILHKKGSTPPTTASATFTSPLAADSSTATHDEDVST